jgi:hypothetical protein
MTYEQALQSAIKNSGRMNDEETLALMLDCSIQVTCGAVSPKLIYEGARRKGLTAKDIHVMVKRNPAEVEALQWGPDCPPIELFHFGDITLAGNEDGTNSLHLSKQATKDFLAGKTVKKISGDCKGEFVISVKLTRKRR